LGVGRSYRTDIGSYRRIDMIDIEADERAISGYTALPESGTGPGILLMHAWWGLNDFFKSLADRLAGEGFVVLAPDLYGGKTASEIEEAEQLIKDFDWRQGIKDEVAALDYLLRHPAVHGDNVGAIGFSMGGGYATWLAALRPEVTAVVLIYGGSEQEADYAQKTEAAFLGHFAEGDEWELDEGVKQLESQLRAAGRDVTFYIYKGVGHWFFEDNRPDAYNSAAAALAWERTLEFLHSKLG
jgi:carboxymethylenebutenolidase